MKLGKLKNILLIAVILVWTMFWAENGKVAEAAEIVEVGETNLTENVIYNGAVKITKEIDLNGYILRVNGDLEIAADVVLNRGTLVVNGNILHTSGTLQVGQGIVEVSGDYRIQNKRVLTDGSQEFLDSDGSIQMKEADGLIKIAGDFITQSSQGGASRWSDGRRMNIYEAGKIEVGGNFVQRNGNEYNFECYLNHTVVFVGKKMHQVEFNSSVSGFANLESEGNILWKGYMGVRKLSSDLIVQSEKGTNLILGGTIDINGKYLDFVTDLKINGNINLNGGMVKVEGDVLHINGIVSIDYGIMEVSGNYRIQNTRNLPDGTLQYIGCDAMLEMKEMDGLVKIGGNFITQSSSAYGAWNNSDGNNYWAGTMEIAGDIVQKNGDARNFCCSDSHKVILTGKKPQKIEFESPEATFNTLVITRPLSEYTFTTTPCWKNLEESATPISDCKIKSISKKAYTGKAITPAVTITYQDTKLVQDTDYTLSYTNNKNTGKATVTITGIGAYTGTIEKSFQIVPVKVTDVELSSNAAKTATLTWKKDTTATGYVIEYSTDKGLKKNVSKITINKKTSTSREITKLTSKKTYYFRIRAYKTISGKKAYGAYSSIVSVKVK